MYGCSGGSPHHVQCLTTPKTTMLAQAQGSPSGLRGDEREMSGQPAHDPLSGERLGSPGQPGPGLANGAQSGRKAQQPTRTLVPALTTESPA